MGDAASAAAAMALVERLAALAVLLATIEMGLLIRLYSPGGVFGWDLVAPYRPLGRWPVMRTLSRFVYSAVGYRALLTMRVFAGVVLLLQPWSETPSLWFRAVPVSLLFATQAAINHHLVPSGANGSHGMLGVLLGTLTLFHLGGSGKDVAWMCCWFLAAQCCLSYAVPGFRKARDAQWRDGNALVALGRHSFFGGPLLGQLLRQPRARVLARATIAFECAFPLVLVLPVPFSTTLLVAGIGFHAANAVLLGLSPFLWAWLACYPAVAWAAGIA